MIKKLPSLLLSIVLIFSLQGCKGSVNGNDSTATLFGTYGDMDFSGTYEVTVGSSAISSALGTITSITLLQAGEILQAVDNLGHQYKGTLIGGYDADKNNVIENNELQATFQLETTTASGINITLICASDSSVQSYTPGTSTTTEQVIEQTVQSGGGTTIVENYIRKEVTNTDATTVIWKQFAGQIMLTGAANHAGTIVMKGDIITSGGNSTTTLSLTKA